MSCRTKTILITLCLLEHAERGRARPQFVVARHGGRSRNELSGLDADARPRFHVNGQDDRRAMQRQCRHRQAEVPRGIIPHWLLS